MVFMRKSLWTMCALVALSYQSAQAMEQSEQTVLRSPSIKLQDLPPEMKVEILNHAFMSAKTEITNFRDIGITLSLVCKDWNEIIRANAKKLVCDYFNIEEKNKDVFWQLFKGKLIYKPDPDSDMGRVDLFISSLPNPLGGEFDLSNCGDTKQYLSLNMGYRKVQNPANARKTELWITPRFLVENEMAQLSRNHHIKEIIGEWDAVKAPIGIIWTWGGWNGYDMVYCDYLTKESMVEFSSENLLKKHRKSAQTRPEEERPGYDGDLGVGEKFHISFVN
ncbi:MAG TPA: F-box protein [Alphaproteobacteria bacterium]|nr:F-box protein [Alphaproteobacteria bacterium]